MKPTVMLVITVGLFWKPEVIYKNLKKIMPALGFELEPRAVEFWDLTAALVYDVCQGLFTFSFWPLGRLIKYKIEQKNLGRLGLKYGSRGLSCGILTVEPVGGIRKKWKR